MSDFASNAQKHYKQKEFDVTDETLRTFYKIYNYDLKVYMKEKPSKYRILLKVFGYPKCSLAIQSVTWLSKVLLGKSIQNQKRPDDSKSEGGVEY